MRGSRRAMFWIERSGIGVASSSRRETLVEKPLFSDENVCAMALAETVTPCRSFASCVLALPIVGLIAVRSEEHTSELQSLMRISYSVFSLKKKKVKISMRKQ